MKYELIYDQHEFLPFVLIIYLFNVNFSDKINSLNIAK